MSKPNTAASLRKEMSEMQKEQQAVNAEMMVRIEELSKKVEELEKELALLKNKKSASRKGTPRKPTDAKSLWTRYYEVHTDFFENKIKEFDQEPLYQKAIEDFEKKKKAADKKAIDAGKEPTKKKMGLSLYNFMKKSEPIFDKIWKMAVDSFDPVALEEKKNAAEVDTGAE